MNRSEYNGWTNRATWVVNVWYNPESRADVEYAREDLENQYDELPDGALKDMLSLDEVDWDQLLDHFEEEESEPDCDDSDDGYALASAGFGTDEDYGYAGDDY